MNTTKTELLEDKIKERMTKIKEELLDITHTDEDGIRGACGIPCHQCDRDEKLFKLIDRYRDSVRLEERQKCYELAVSEVIDLKDPLYERYNPQRLNNFNHGAISSANKIRSYMEKNGQEVILKQTNNNTTKGNDE